MIERFKAQFFLKAFFVFLTFEILGVGFLFSQDQGIQYTLYYFSDTGNNSVLTRSFNIVKEVFDKTLMMIDIEVDQVEVPPIIDGATGASRPARQHLQSFEKSRGQVIVGLERFLGDNTTLGGNLYRSYEADYASLSAAGIFRQSLFQKNTTLTLRGQWNKDEVGEITKDDRYLGNWKRVYTGGGNLTQLISPTTVLEINADYIMMRGFLSDPYRLVKIENLSPNFERWLEHHPDERERKAVTVYLRRYLPGIKGGLNGGYRYYWDDWSVDSHTAFFNFNKYVFKDLIFGLDLRFYSQSQAFFFKEDYQKASLTTNSYISADYKLNQFQSTNFGVSLKYFFRDLLSQFQEHDFLENLSVEIKYFRYFNDLNFAGNIVQASLLYSLID